MSEDVKKTPKIGQGLAGPGRPKGKQNKTTALLKDAIIKAAQAAGDDIGEEGMVSYLKHQAHENPGPFMGLLGKVLPLQLGSDPDNPTIINVVVGGDNA